MDSEDILSMADVTNSWTGLTVDGGFDHGWNCRQARIQKLDSATSISEAAWENWDLATKVWL